MVLLSLSQIVMSISHGLLLFGLRCFLLLVVQLLLGFIHLLLNLLTLHLLLLLLGEHLLLVHVLLLIEGHFVLTQLFFFDLFHVVFVARRHHLLVLRECLLLLTSTFALGSFLATFFVQGSVELQRLD